jgi:hypothetical protein
MVLVGSWQLLEFIEFLLAVLGGFWVAMGGCCWILLVLGVSWCFLVVMLILGVFGLFLHLAFGICQMQVKNILPGQNFGGSVGGDGGVGSGGVGGGCGSWWFLVFSGGSWWFLVILGGYWWLLVVIVGSWWFLVILDDFCCFFVVLVVFGVLWWFLVFLECI